MSAVATTSLDASGGRRFAVLTIDNPPVNALSFACCAELLAALEATLTDDGVAGVIFTGANGIFSAGADVNDFAGEPPPNAKNVRDVIAAIEGSDTPFAAAIDGTCLGGALELALACDYRVATRRSKLGLPEIKLGLLPGAGGTQRLPRLIGARAALEFMLQGRSYSAERAGELRIVDELVDGDAVAAAAGLLQRNAGGKRRLSQRTAVLGDGLSPQAEPFVVSQAHKMVPREDAGGFAAHTLIDAVQAAVDLPFAYGIARETRLFDELVRSSPSVALRHLFFAERELSKVPGLPPASPRDVTRAGVIGAGTMGTGIAISLAQAGIPVAVVDTNDAAVEKARQTVMGTFMYLVGKGRMTQQEAWERARAVTFTDDWNELAGSDVVVEAVFEDLAVKRDVFARLASVVPADAVLATNTSTLDVDVLAQAAGHSERVVGLHFFVPANIMPLLEIVRGRDTSAQTIATVFALGKRLRKKAVLSGNAFGFIGNRMIFDYANEALAIAEEGVPPARLDAVMRAFGFAMGPFAMADLSGLDVAAHVASAAGPAQRSRTGVLQQLVARGRLGQKTMAGYFRYDKAVGKGREPIADPEVEALFAEAARGAGIAPRDVSDDEIVQRLVYALVNRGAFLLQDGIALRPGDIDIEYVYGYGFPPHRGGPMWYADEVGAATVYAAVEEFQHRFGEHWVPAPLLRSLAESGGTFAAMPPEAVALV